MTLEDLIKEKKYYQQKVENLQLEIINVQDKCKHNWIDFDSDALYVFQRCSICQKTQAIDN